MPKPSALESGIATRLLHHGIRNRARTILAGLLISLLFFAIGPGDGTANARTLFAPVQSSGPKRLQERTMERIKRRTTTESADLVHIDVELLRRCSTPVFHPNERKLTFHNGRLDCGKNNVRVGLISGAGQGMFVIHDGKVTGTIARGEATFRVEPVRGMHALFKVAAALFPKEDDEPTRRYEERKEGRKDIYPNVGAAPTNAQIDVLVAYTPSVANATADMTAFIQKAILEANDSYRNSDIQIRLNLVDSFSFQYTEGAKTFDQIVRDFAGSTAVNSRRDRSGADVSVLLIKGSGVCRPPSPTGPQSSDLNCCGLGDALMAKDTTAFAVVHYECALDPNYSFAHEIGHLQGATHDVDGVLPAFRPYGHGFQHTTGPARWRTIMSYDCSPHCVRLPYWSNPRMKHNGAPMGTTDGNDNARILNETAATVAGFRNRPQARRSTAP